MPKELNGRRMTSKKRIEQRTLAFVNRINAAFGRKPLARLPRGSNESDSCPIAIALRGQSEGFVTVGGTSIGTTNPRIAAALTKVLGPGKRGKYYYNRNETVWTGLPQYLDDFVQLHDTENAFGLQKAA